MPVGSFISVRELAIRQAFVLLCVFCLHLCWIRAAAADPRVLALIGRTDALLVTESDGRSLLEKNAETPLIPASTLKILTALTALQVLGPDYRFPTEFYTDRENNLRIKGYGDPLLVSEILPDIAAAVSRHVPTIRRILLDESYFRGNLRIPGAADRSVQPYDAPVGALCVNFNTVYFKKDPASGATISAEPQTPLLPFVRTRILASGLAKGGIILTNDRHEASLYAGHLFRYFFTAAGISTGEPTLLEKPAQSADQLVYRYYSVFDMETIIAKLLYYSNNFIANQLLLAAGATRFGPPGTLEKGVRAMQSVAEDNLGIHGTTIKEGSGLSRGNRLSARMLEKMLAAFEPHHALMRQENGQYYKTGTLTGIQTRAGYFSQPDGRKLRFVVMLNTPGKSIRPVMSALSKWVKERNGSDGLLPTLKESAGQ